MLDLVISQRRRDIGGFEVGRVLPAAARRMVGPFIFFDHLGPLGIWQSDRWSSERASRATDQAQRVRLA